ncbi:MAG: NADH-quinone oxidoreductase subunit L [Actinomycetota bacterium]|jgi:NADH-quinone oxidoreductase subunit L|nr:NADH-quinone oxidoreductase subunit L [Actinomycetota bacterium]
MSSGAVTWAWVVLALPLVGTAGIALAWRVLPGRLAGYLGSLTVGLSFLAGIATYVSLEELPPEGRKVVGSAFTYIGTDNLNVDLSILVDPLSVFMVLVVTGVSFLIHVYSIAYLGSDRGYARFFSYLNFFVFSMLLLVLAGNLVLLIVGWAFVGAASYLLISFWYRRDTATTAGIKAFVINVIGDVGLVVAAFLILDRLGTLDYLAAFEAAKEVPSGDGTLVAACLLLLVGAFAKSGQLPLHTWLPDAMEGPTPVSALIHAATMVTAGVYLIARFHPLFERAPTAAAVGAIIGTATLLFAATVALVSTDLKRIIAYSTISQIGYMVLAVCAFAYSAGLFHLMTHAFFKALLFMGAGSIVSALGMTNGSIDRMGGFRKAMPFTFATFTIGAGALAGLPLLSGFFSKDEIISYTLHRGGLYTVLGICAYVAALLTAFYAFRMVFRVFFGEPVPEAKQLADGEPAHVAPQNPLTGEEEDTDVGFPGPEHHVAERSFPMKAAMAPLALLAVVAGVVAIPGVTAGVEHFLEPTFAESKYLTDSPPESEQLTGLAIGGVLALLGVGAAYLVYLRRPGLAGSAQKRLAGVHSFLFNAWYLNQLYDLLFVRPGRAAGRFGRITVERVLVQNTLVGGPSGVVRAGTALARAIQTGYLRAYALLLLVGVCALALYFLIASG